MASASFKLVKISALQQSDQFIFNSTKVGLKTLYVVESQRVTQYGTVLQYKKAADGQTTYEVVKNNNFEILKKI